MVLKVGEDGPNTMHLLRIALIVGGGYFVFKAMGVDLLGGIMPEVGPLQPDTELPVGGEVPVTLPGQPVAETLPRIPQRDVTTEMIQASGGAVQLSYDQWNYYYQQTTGAFGPDWETVVPGGERDDPMSLLEFLELIGSGGLSGMGTTEAAGYERSNVYYQ